MDYPIVKIILSIIGLYLFLDIIFRPSLDVTEDNKLLLWYNSGSDRKWIFIKQLKK